MCNELGTRGEREGAERGGEGGEEGCNELTQGKRDE